MKNIKLVLIIVILTLAIVIAFLNKQDVETNLIFKTVKMPGILLILSTLGIGFLGGMITSSFLRKKSIKSKKE
ncbi:MAG: DUF1049 domain-containing protein [Sedimentisphaerales bacterium]|nr:DUF1049 domain-containing protein [Sedimentisphaerales bacterium]